MIGAVSLESSEDGKPNARTISRSSAFGDGDCGGVSQRSEGKILSVE